MFIVYQIFTFFCYIFLQITYLFSTSIRQFVQVRKKEKKKILNASFSLGKTLWFHSASVGELEQAKALALEYERLEPKTYIIHSVFSQSVEEKYLQHTQNRFFFHLPLDFYNSYNFIFETFKPQTLVIFAWDSWPNLIFTANKYQVKIVLCCAVLSKRSIFPFHYFFSYLFKKIDLILVSHELFLEKFKNSKIQKNIKIGGDTRFDAVITKIKNQTNHFQKSKNYPFSKILILASTYPICEKLWLPVLKKDFLREYAIWIFPHKIDKNHILQIQILLRKENIFFDKFSQKMDFSKRVVLFDVMGLLAFAYKEANIVYVGGALHNKVHNTIEPAYFGCSILFGPKIQNSSEALILKKQKGGFIISDRDSIEQSVKHTEQNEEAIREKNKSFVLENQGSSYKIYQEIHKIQNNPSSLNL